MKIRIKGKGLPKAQMWNSQIGVPGIELPLIGQPNYAWMNLNTQPAPVNPVPQQPLYTMATQGTPISNPDPIVPIGRRKTTGSFTRDMMNVFDGVNTAMNFMTPVLHMVDSKIRDRETERAYRQNLFNLAPVNYMNNRGDYEINTGMVDPYNTGAKSKGQFANPYYTPMAEDGLSLGPISFSDEPVQRNLFQYASEVSEPMSPAVTSKVISKPEVSGGDIKTLIASKESNNNYKALPLDKSGNLKSSAAGKYQFLWNTHKNDINRVTGVRTKEEFLNSPDAQEAYMDYWDKTVLTPTANRIRQKYKVNAPINKIKYIVHFAGAAGAENYFATGKETQDSFGTTTSQLWNNMEYGGENNEPMKIRITGGPQQMAYGGQANYGLDLGRKKVYTDMPESPYDNPSKVLGPVPEEYATIEAEKDETILTDVDGDGMREHMVVGGKKHEQGGTPLNAQPGDFVFSDHKPKMAIKSERILSLFGKKFKKGGYTPAEIAKSYDINKYKAILEDKNADPISKSTAKLMISNYEKKLGMLSLVQEAKKDFPQGIPAVAEAAMPTVAYGGYIPEMGYGGYLDHYQTKGEVKPRTIPTKEEFDKLVASGKYKQIPGTNNWEYRNKTVIPGTPDKTIVHKGTPGKKYVPNENDWWRSLTPEQKAAHNAKVRQKIKTDPVYTGTPDRTEIIKGTPEQVNEEMDLITYMSDQGSPVPTTVPGVPDFTPTGSNIPFGWTNPDRRNLGTALMNRGYINKYNSVRRDINPVLPDFRNMDWRGRAAELQGTYNSQMNTLGTYQSPTSLAANASFMAGQQAENLINRAIDPIEQQNVGIYNQVAGQQAGIMNQAIANNAQNVFLRSQDRAIVNQKYDQEMIDSNNAITQAINTGDTNAAGIYNTNITESPYYYIDPRTQKMKFNSPAARAAFEAARRSAGPSDSDMVAQYLSIRSRLSGVPENEKDDIARELMGLNKSGRSSSTVYPMNPRMNRYTVQQPFMPNGTVNPYQQGQ